VPEVGCPPHATARAGTNLQGSSIKACVAASVPSPPPSFPACGRLFLFPSSSISRFFFPTIQAQPAVSFVSGESPAAACSAPGAFSACSWCSSFVSPWVPPAPPQHSIIAYRSFEPHNRRPRRPLPIQRLSPCVRSLVSSTTTTTTCFAIPPPTTRHSSTTRLLIVPARLHLDTSRPQATSVLLEISNSVAACCADPWLLHPSSEPLPPLQPDDAGAWLAQPEPVDHCEERRFHVRRMS